MGSFFSFFLLDMAARLDLRLNVDIYESRDFSQVAPKGCNMCGGIISESLVQNLAAEGINLPPTIVQRGIDSYVLHTEVGKVRMDTPVMEMRIAAYREQIRAKSPKSLAIWQQNRTVMPAGVGSLFRLADPFPMVVKRAKGARIWDADDNEYLDFMLGFGVMVLGNGPEEVEEALREALPRGAHYGQCHEHEYAFARLFCDMVPGVDKVTFCNSGTEATMSALRLARAATGRPLIAKFEGGYHGTHDLLAVSFGRPHPGPDMSGPLEDPATVPESPGLAEGAWKETIVLPFNHVPIP